MATMDPVEFKLKPGAMIIKLSMDECIDYIFQNRDLIIRKTKNLNKLELIRAAIFNTQSWHEINRKIAYMLLYDNVLKNSNLLTADIELEKYKKEHEKGALDELKKNFMYNQECTNTETE